jgi:hypothetical protein
MFVSFGYYAANVGIMLVSALSIRTESLSFREMKNG